MKGCKFNVKVFMCSFLACLCSLGVVMFFGSCTNDTYDLEKLDMEMNLVPGINIPVSRGVVNIPSRSLVYTKSDGVPVYKCVVTPEEAHVNLVKLKDMMCDNKDVIIVADVTNNTGCSLGGTVEFDGGGVSCICMDKAAPKSVSRVSARVRVEGDVLDLRTATFRIVAEGTDNPLMEAVPVKVDIVSLQFPEGIVVNAHK